MILNKSLIPSFFILMVFLTACQSSEKSNVQGKNSIAEFEKFCKDRTPDNWMNMKPMRNGEFTSDKSCWGCMSEDGMNHFCTLEEYTTYLENEK